MEINGLYFPPCPLRAEIYAYFIIIIFIDVLYSRGIFVLGTLPAHLRKTIEMF